MRDNKDPRMTPREDLVGELYDEDWDKPDKELKGRYCCYRVDNIIRLFEDIYLTLDEAEDLANQLLSLAQDIREGRL